MADRSFYSDAVIDKGIVTLFGGIQFNGASTPTFAQWNPLVSQRFYSAASANGSRGLKSIVRNGTGDYTITLQDSYQRVVGFSITFISNTSGAGPIAQIKCASNPNAAGATVASGLDTTYRKINFLTFSAQGVAADPANTELGVLQIQLQNSSSL